MAAKFKDVEAFIKFLVSLGGIFEIDSEGYVINKGEDVDDPVLVKVKNQYKRLMSIKEVITDNDALILNPLNENSREAQDARWIYTTLAVGLTRRITEVIKFVKMVTDAADDPNFTVPANIMKFVSKYSKRIDDNTMLHLKWISKNKSEFVNVWYRRKQKEARFRCILFDPDIHTKFPKVTKKSLKLLTEITAEILGVSSNPAKAQEEIIEKFSTTSDLITSPKIEAILGTYYKVYSKLNKYLDFIDSDDDDFVIDLSEFGNHLKNISAYYDKTKWFTGVTSPDSPVIVNPGHSSIPTAEISATNIPRNFKTATPVNMMPTASTSSIPMNMTRLYGPTNNVMPQAINAGNFTGLNPNQGACGIPPRMSCARPSGYGFVDKIPTR